MLVNIFSVLATIYSASIIEKYGRKKLMIIGWGLLCLSLLIITTSLHFDFSLVLIILAVCLFIISYGLAAGPIIYVYLADTLPDIGIGMIVSAMFFGHSIVSYIFPIAKERLGITVTFLIFFILSVIGLIFMVTIIKESKGKSMKEIWLEYGI